MAKGTLLIHRMNRLDFSINKNIVKCIVKGIQMYLVNTFSPFYTLYEAIIIRRIVGEINTTSITSNELEGAYPVSFEPVRCLASVHEEIQKR